MTTGWVLFWIFCTPFGWIGMICVGLAIAIVVDEFLQMIGAALGGPVV